MTDILAPSAIGGNTLPGPYGAPIQLILGSYLSRPTYTDLPRYWSWSRDVVLAASVELEDMWASAVARTATKFAAHGYVISDSQDSQRKIAASQELLKRADGGQGWVPFALKLVQDVLTTDNGGFVRVRRAGEETQRIRLKAAMTISRNGYNEQAIDEIQITSAPKGGRVQGLYHLDSLRCVRTGNLAYPVRYTAVDGTISLLRYDQILAYADMPSPRAELFGVGRSAASRAYTTVAKIGAMERLVYEGLTGGGAHKIALVKGLLEQTLKDIIAGAQADAASKNMIYYLGTILGAIPSDIDLQVVEIRLKELLSQFDPKTERDNAYLIYANAIGVPVQDIQPLSGQGLGTGTQTVVLQEAGRGVGMAAFLKWWEQTVSDRLLPATTTLEFRDENDVRDQKARAEVAKLRAEERKTRIDSGEISPAIARQLAADAKDLPPEMLQADATPAGELSDDDKPLPDQPLLNPAARQLIAGEPTAPPAPAGPGGMATKDADNDLTDEAIAAAQRILESAHA